MAVGIFFSAAPTAQNSPELHFHFINSFIQWSLLVSLTKSFLVLSPIDLSYKKEILSAFFFSFILSNAKFEFIKTLTELQMYCKAFYLDLFDLVQGLSQRGVWVSIRPPGIWEVRKLREQINKETALLLTQPPDLKT